MDLVYAEREIINVFNSLSDSAIYSINIRNCYKNYCIDNNINSEHKIVYITSKAFYICDRYFLILSSLASGNRHSRSFNFIINVQHYDKYGYIRPKYVPHIENIDNNLRNNYSLCVSLFDEVIVEHVSLNIITKHLLTINDDDLILQALPPTDCHILYVAGSLNIPYIKVTNARGNTSWLLPDDKVIIENISAELLTAFMQDDLLYLVALFANSHIEVYNLDIKTYNLDTNNLKLNSNLILDKDILGVVPGKVCHSIKTIVGINGVETYIVIRKQSAICNLISWSTGEIITYNIEKKSRESVTILDADEFGFICKAGKKCYYYERDSNKGTEIPFGKYAISHTKYIQLLWDKSVNDIDILPPLKKIIRGYLS